MGEAELGRDVVEGRVGYVEGVVDADDARVFGAPDGFPGFGGIDYGLVETSEAHSICGPGQADGGGFGSILGAVEEEDCLVEDDGGGVIEVS